MASASTARAEAPGAGAACPYPPARLAVASGLAPRIGMAGGVRIVARLCGLLLALAVCLPLHYLWRLFRASSPWPMYFLRWGAWFAGARVEKVGVPLRRDVFFVSNHVSWLDILALAGASGTSFVAKAELGRAPVVGWLSRLNRTVFVSRENRMGVAEQINQLKDALAENWSVTVFPEGTTTDGQSLLPFKTPMLRVLEPPPPGVMVQPVLLDYGAAAEEIGWIGDESGIANALRVLSRPGSFRLRIHFLDPFSPADHGGRKAIAAESRMRIEAALIETLGKPLRPFWFDVGPVRYVAAEPLPPLDEAEIARRRPVWSALADLFLDTDVALLREAGARNLAASGYTIAQVERILLDEVTPACRFNLREIAGEWAGFNDEWLEARVRDVRVAPGTGKPDAVMWQDWLLLRSAMQAAPATVESSTSNG